MIERVETILNGKDLFGRIGQVTSQATIPPLKGIIKTGIANPSSNDIIMRKGILLPNIKRL